MASEKYTVSELERESGVKARTIRKYIQMGLVPQAETRGPGAGYTDDHLARLKVVERLRTKSSSLTLDRIRLILQQLSPGDIEAVASNQTQIEALIDIEPPESTALEYIRSVRSQPVDAVEHVALAKMISEPSSPEHPATKRIRDSKTTKQTTVEQIVEAMEQLSGRRSSPRSVKKETWRRIEITPDIELSIRGEFDDDQQAQFYRIADLLRYLLERGVK